MPVSSCWSYNVCVSVFAYVWRCLSGVDESGEDYDDGVDGKGGKCGHDEDACLFLRKTRDVGTKSLASL